MKRWSRRTYWMTNETWYSITNGAFRLTSLAPEEAIESFKLWKSNERVPFRRKLLRFRAKYFDWLFVRNSPWRNEKHGIHRSEESEY